MLISESNYQYMWVEIGDDKTYKSSDVKLLGAAIDNKFNIGSHIANICLKVTKRLRALDRLAKLLSFDKNYSFLKQILK